MIPSSESTTERNRTPTKGIPSFQTTASTRDGIMTRIGTSATSSQMAMEHSSWNTKSNKQGK
jgi:hypothetical protein